MTDRRLFAAALGFAFVAAWIGFSFGDALLCLLGAAAFFASAAVLDGSIDLGELQTRLSDRDDTPTYAAPQARPRARVQ